MKPCKSRLADIREIKRLGADAAMGVASYREPWNGPDDRDRIHQESKSYEGV
jgi:hypothetical protein